MTTRTGLMTPAGSPGPATAQTMTMTMTAALAGWRRAAVVPAGSPAGPGRAGPGTAGPGTAGPGTAGRHRCARGASNETERRRAGRAARAAPVPRRGRRQRRGRRDRPRSAAGPCRRARTCRWPSSRCGSQGRPARGAAAARGEPARPGSRRSSRPTASSNRVDTALLIPQVDPVQLEAAHSRHGGPRGHHHFDELLHRPLIEDYLTLCCVSNPVGGPYIGNAKWLGASLAALIREAKPARGADQLLATSVDGFHLGLAAPGGTRRAGLPARVAMNGAALAHRARVPRPPRRARPVRYVSACKWVVDLEVTTFAAAQAYWVPRGWSQMADQDRVPHRRAG